MEAEHQILVDKINTILTTFNQDKSKATNLILKGNYITSLITFLSLFLDLQNHQSSLKFFRLLVDILKLDEKGLMLTVFSAAKGYDCISSLFGSSVVNCSSEQMDQFVLILEELLYVGQVFQK